MVNYEQNESAVNVYLSRLTTEGARRSMRNELDKIAKYFSDGECNADTLEWQRCLRADLVIENKESHNQS